MEVWKHLASLSHLETHKAQISYLAALSAITTKKDASALTAHKNLQQTTTYTFLLMPHIYHAKWYFFICQGKCDNKTLKIYEENYWKHF